MSMTGKPNSWHLGPHLCKILTGLQKLVLAASTYHFLGINVDRLFAIKRPLAYRDWQLKSFLVKRPLVLIWICGLAPAIPMMVDYTGHYTEEKWVEKCECHFPYDHESWVWWNSVLA